jgi:acetyl-CoA carboxylase carboxyl transferase subunit beta
MLQFKDLKPYKDRLVAAKKKSKLDDAISVGVGTVDKTPLVVACMDFGFIGGSMGSVVGERIARAIDYSLEKKYPHCS